MKIYALNASPRKQWNSDEMLESFIQGVKDTNPNIEIEKINLYDLEFKGCRSCFACRMKSTENGQCLFHDGAYSLLRGIKNSDGFVFSTPVYYFDVPSQMRAILERLFYSGKAEREIPISVIYTMNQKEEVMIKRFKHHLDEIASFLKNTFNSDPNQIYIYNTLNWKNPELYQFSQDSYEAKKEYHDENYKNDLKQCYEAGVLFAKKINKLVFIKKDCAKTQSFLMK